MFSNSKIGFIGGGNMSSAIGNSIIKSGILPPDKIWVSGPHIETLKHWVDWGTHASLLNGDVFQNCNIIFLGIKPQRLCLAIQDCEKTLPSIDQIKVGEKLFISMLAGVKLVRLYKELSILPGTIKVIRILPNTPMMLGVGACIYAPGENVDQKYCDILEAILNNCGIYERVAEESIDSLGVISGCSPAYLYMTIEAMADGAVKQGVPRSTAIKFAAQAMLGAAKMVLDSAKHPGQLKDEVCSPGGSTICGVAELERGGIRSAFINAVEASTKRNIELGN